MIPNTVGPTVSSYGPGCFVRIIYARFESEKWVRGRNKTLQSGLVYVVDIEICNVSKIEETKLRKTCKLQDHNEITSCEAHNPPPKKS